jgi:hypothetical protein
MTRQATIIVSDYLTRGITGKMNILGAYTSEIGISVDPTPRCLAERQDSGISSASLRSSADSGSSARSPSTRCRGRSRATFHGRLVEIEHLGALLGIDVARRRMLLSSSAGMGGTCP